MARKVLLATAKVKKVAPADPVWPPARVERGALTLFNSYVREAGMDKRVVLKERNKDEYVPRVKPWQEQPEYIKQHWRRMVMDVLTACGAKP